MMSMEPLRICGSSDTVDKAIVDTSEPLAAIADATPFVSIRYAGTSEVLCSLWDAPSSSGEYALGARCALIDRSRSVEFVFGAGIRSTTGELLSPVTYQFTPGGTGPECRTFFAP